MAPAPYLLHVNSRSTQVDDSVWKQWYSTEHVPDVVNSKMAIRALFYEEIELPGGRKSGNPRKFLAIYQTEYKEPLLTEHLKDMRVTSTLFEPAGANSDSIWANGDFDARNYELVQAYDPKSIGEVPAPEIITAEAQPKDPEDFDKWYREEHLDLLSKIPGYRRTLRYKLGPRTALTQGEDPPAFFAIHEVDDVSKALSGKEMEAANGTEWTKKNLANSDPFIARGWRLVHTEGY